MGTLAYPATFFVVLLHAIHLARSQPYIGVNYGQVADNLPSPADTVKLLQATTIQKVRLYGSDPGIIKALANTGIGIVIGAANGDVPPMAGDAAFAKNWVDSNVVPFYPSSNIILISVGNEALTSDDQNLKMLLLPAMQNLQKAIDSASLGGKIKVSTVHSMAVLASSEPPSAGAFDPNLADLLKGVLGFSSATGSPFAINPYPYFAYRADSKPDTLAYCLFQPNPGRPDAGTKITYTNMFDAQVDAVRSALNAMGFKDVEIVVAETGWPYKGDPDEVGASIENAKAYNGNLVAHLRSMAGTPLMPGKPVDTYLFALYDEDLKPGPGSERAFGLFHPPHLTAVYDAGLSNTTHQGPAAASAAPTTPPSATTPTNTTTKVPTTPAAQSPKAGGRKWCVKKEGVTDAQLQANIDYVCGQADIDCRPIQPGGSCFEPNNLPAHASYAMNLYYQTTGRDSVNCDFSGTAMLSSNNPSYGGCIYPHRGA